MSGHEVTLAIALDSERVSVESSDKWFQGSLGALHKSHITCWGLRDLLISCSISGRCLGLDRGVKRTCLQKFLVCSINKLA